MERRAARRRGEMFIGAALAVVISAGIKGSSAKGEQPYVYKPYPQDIFTPVDPNQDVQLGSNPEPSPSQPVNVVFNNDGPGRISDGFVRVPPFTSPVPTHESTPAPATRAPIARELPSFEWLLDPQISFYGPGFYGNRTACGEKLTKTLVGVASRTLACGTPVTFQGKDGKAYTMPVVDRGPYVTGRIFDLTGAACTLLDHCYTGPINYKIGK